jgi:hypothetical protein
MSTATIIRPAPVPDVRRPSPRTRPVRRAVPARGPLARPARVVPAPTTRPGHPSAVRSCRLQVEPGGGSAWRLTDRGIAVVLVLAAMIVVAAVTVVGLTAWQVTGPGDQAWSAAFTPGR